MKLLLLAICVSLPAFANFMAASDLEKAKANAGDPVSVYVDRDNCQTARGEKCFTIGNKNPRCASVAYSIGDEEQCANSGDCTTKAAAKTCDANLAKVFHGDRDSDGDLEVWCALATAFNENAQCLTDLATEKAAADAEEAETKSDYSKAKNKLKGMKATINAATSHGELKPVLRDMVDVLKNLAR